VIIGTLPVVIAISANLRDRRRDGQLPWLRLAPSLLLIGRHRARQSRGTAHLLAAGADGRAATRFGALLAVGAVVCWTWYPIRNADWLRHHAGRSPRTWATAQGVATLPLSAAAFALFLGCSRR
jgi:drug/metabolite transporter (DMT)-like permease